ncbi:alpha-2-macroglobulin family protein [Dyadobacter pollutisoli]|uniref:MG2 domain-containing protein n=1 Tax=Dyadobacter pollutisoli TaxID=2910158 RepID=A0A9E8N5S1_9BACT|nr:alpha-2-macroglobulin family protein [Dyadobacter pollutisoli]WAC10354.1 MG2 domain-containing protein [Dyadobacter pollutisoli]
MKIHPKPFGYLLTLVTLLLTMHTNGQNIIKNYDAQWKIVEGHQTKGLPKSALEEVEKIYQLAKKEKQDAQVIKAAVYMITLQAENQEDHDIAAIRALEKEVEASAEPAKSILTSLLASQYHQYYQNIRWQLYNRTATSAYSKEDVSTWGTEDFHQKITALYLASLQHDALLKQTKLEHYEAIIIKGNARKLRPTLYDLLVFTALPYFSSDERNIKKPAYAFEINNASAFDPAADFIHRKFETKDSTSLEFYALQLYQQIIAFHINDPQPDALIDADIERMLFVKQKSVHPDANDLYLMAINHLAEQYQSTPAAAQAWFLKAAWYNDQSSRYVAGEDSTNRFDRVKAIEICKKIIKENPDTQGGIGAYNLLTGMTEKSLTFSVENVNIPSKPFRTLVEYRNFYRLYLRLVKATDVINNLLENDNNNSKWNIITSMQPIRAWEQSLVDTKDYQVHRVEIKIDALPVGEYILIASNEASFKDSKAVLGARSFHISNISYVQKQDDIFVLNRDTGQPLEKANVRIWKSSYDYGLRKYIKIKGALLISDRNGYCKKPKRDTKTNSNELLEITHGEDRLFLQKENNTYYYNEERADQRDLDAIYLFTDRSLYRPGQMVHYKGITRDSNAVLKDKTYEIDVVLYNANREEVGKATHKVNEYGSFSGTFNLPKTGLNGSFYIEADDVYRTEFHVEDYKRPKFSVALDTLKNSYKVNDTITVSGAATAYAGNAIDGAKVTYRVVRNSRFIYAWSFKRWWLPPSTMEITHGEAVTDLNGKFKLTFEAIPDLKTDKKLDPIFDYTIYADVTDSNGETRSAESTISVSYKSFLLQASIPEKAEASELKTLSLRTENMNGEFVKSDITIKVTKIEPESRLIRERYWHGPDLFVMTKNDYITHFPNDEFDQETEMENWRETGQPKTKLASLDKYKPFDISDLSLNAGFYKIQVTAKNESGEEVTDTKHIELTNPSSAKLAKPEYLWTNESRPIEPGKNATLTIGTTADNVFVINSSSKKSDKKEGYQFFGLQNEKRVLNFSATEEDRGGYTVNYLFVKHNRVYQHSETIAVPWTNKELLITYETFRDKTLPGSDEKWRVRISGYKKERVAAEMLASMYDASLEQFYVHNWIKPNVWGMSHRLPDWNRSENFASSNAETRYLYAGDYKSHDKSYDQLIRVESISNVQKKSMAGGGRNVRNRNINEALAMKVGGIARDQVKGQAPGAPPMIGEDKEELFSVVTVGYGSQTKKEQPAHGENGASENAPAIRKNFNETAFFFPDLKTDENGDISFSFTMPEALTRWKFQALAHTKDLALGYSSKEIVTQKELMVQPNASRFLREGDQLSFPAKVVNLTDHALNGIVSLQLMDAETNLSINDLFKNIGAEKPFEIQAGQSATIIFPIEIPKDYTKAVIWRVVAKSGNLSDGEENILPVLSNRMLVTESLPIATRGTGTKNFKFQKLLNSGSSKTLKSKSLTVEYTSNPAWYAIQALPYLMEYPYECAEQTWNRYYANSLATYVVGSSPRIAQVFEKWRTTDTTALMSNLQKNQELKSVLLEETPWVLAAKTEAEQKRNIALLFDLVKMSSELTASLDKLIQMQSSNGGFVWFKGGPDDLYMTQYILTGIGHLKKINALRKDQLPKINAIETAAIPYLDKRIKERYDELVKAKTMLAKYTPGPNELQYLYMRSFFPGKPIPAASQKAYQFFKERAKLTWTSQSKYLQGLTALALQRTNDVTTPKAILKSLKETAIRSEELGMYWKNNQRGWWWHEAPIERQALLIEAFQEITNDVQTVDDLKTWLLKNKQTNNWESTKATAEACYALLSQGINWLADERITTVKLGDTSIKQEENSVESGTGYFKKSINAENVVATMGNIEVEVSGTANVSKQPGWGAVYWQYFEDLDKISMAETPLKLSKQLFLEKNSDNGPVLSPVKNGDILHVGDKIKVRVELRADRDMEYVHMKDMRASGLEPVNVLSGFKWQDGLGYYESTRDASTNFFFSTLRKGTYVFEYPLFVTHEGDFSNGITSIQCMYAPEFTAHSEGVRMKVVNKK